MKELSVENMAALVAEQMGWPVEECQKDFILFVEYSNHSNLIEALKEWTEETEHQGIFEQEAAE